MQCQAKAKSTGQQCRRRAVTGKRVCTVHGGLTPGGIASPNFKTGRYSKYLPQRLLERYQQAAQDPELLALREDIALLDARISELLSQVDSGESGKRWQELVRLRGEVLGVAQAGDRDQFRQVLQKLLETINQGASDFETWSEIVELLDQRRRLVETEQRRLVAMQQMITTEQAMTLVTALATSVRSHILSHLDHEVAQDVLRAIQTDLTRLLNRGPGNPSD